jgi:ATP-dependent Clp protease protease subunit|tara:strand:+ start:352 stop:999 length:648 start_codon:yes stop_codon:yes gene_type:complete
MSDLYNDGKTSTTAGNVEASYDVKETATEKDIYFQEFREFDYGIDIESNIILVQDEIAQGMVFDTISKVRLLRKINKDLKSVTILLNSPGGDVVETLALIDYIRTIKDTEGIETNIVCRGSAMSAAALLLTAGTGLRAASKHSKIMVHQLSTFNMGKLEDVKSNAKFAEQLEEDCNSIMEECTNKDKKFWKENQRTDYFLSAEDALELGIIDKII